jgi:hypothetical protein
MSRYLRRAVRLWWVLSTPLFLVGFVTAWAGVASDRLAVMQLGLGLCAPLLLGLYLALGAFIVAAPVVTVWCLWWVPREVIRQNRARRADRLTSRCSGPGHAGALS